MPHVHAIAFFCEDIREEVGPKDSLMGILPENLRVSSIPGVIPKLGVYIRFLIPTYGTYEAFKIHLRFEDGTSIQIGEIQKELIDSEIQKAKDEHRPMVGFISKALASPFPVTMTGKIQVVTNIGEELVLGGLNISLIDESANPSATDAAPPASQSPPVA